MGAPASRPASATATLHRRRLALRHSAHLENRAGCGNCSVVQTASASRLPLFPNLRRGRDPCHAGFRSHNALDRTYARVQPLNDMRPVSAGVPLGVEIADKTFHPAGGEPLTAVHPDLSFEVRRRICVSTWPFRLRQDHDAAHSAWPRQRLYRLGATPGWRPHHCCLSGANSPSLAHR